MDDTAIHNLVALDADSEHSIGDIGLQKSPTLANKMDILTWTLRAAPFLSEQRVWQVLDGYRRKELPLISNLLERYFSAKTNSQAVLVAADALQRQSDRLNEDRFDIQTTVWAAQVTEMLVANEEQANLCLRKSRLIELIFIFMTQYLINNQRQHIKLNAQLFKSFARIMSGLMPINHARAQVLMARGRYTNSREFL